MKSESWIKDALSRFGPAPKAPYPNFSAYVQAYDREPYTPDGKHRCLGCMGSGRVVAPWERPDPVEGYKLADRVDCRTCGGTGRVPITVYRRAYSKLRAKYAEDRAEWRSKDALRKSGLSKLTEDEARALRLL